MKLSSQLYTMISSLLWQSSCSIIPIHTSYQNLSNCHRAIEPCLTRTTTTTHRPRVRMPLSSRLKLAHLDHIRRIHSHRAMCSQQQMGRTTLKQQEAGLRIYPSGPMDPHGTHSIRAGLSIHLTHRRTQRTQVTSTPQTIEVQTMEEAQAIECREALVTDIGTWNLNTRREIAMKPSWVQYGLDLYVVTLSISWHDILWHVEGLGKDGIVEEDIGTLMISDYGLLLIIDRLGPRSGQDRRWFISPRHVLSNSSRFRKSLILSAHCLNQYFGMRNGQVWRSGWIREGTSFSSPGFGMRRDEVLKCCCRGKSWQFLV